MVFEKNMKNSLIVLIIIPIFLISCSKKKFPNLITSPGEYESIPLNVYDYNVILNDQSFTMPNYFGFDVSFLKKELTDWGNKKFKVNGLENSLSLIIKNFSLKKKKC